MAEERGIEEERLERIGRRLSLARRGAMGAAAVAVLLVIVAALTPEGFVLERRQQPAQAVIPDLPLVADYLLLALAFAITVAAMIFYFVVVGGRGGQQDRQRGVPLRLKVIVFIFAIAALVVADQSYNDGRLASSLGRVVNAGKEATPGPGKVGDEPLRSKPLGYVVTGVMGLLLVGIVGGGYLLLRRPHRPPPSEKERLKEALLEDIEGGIEDLEVIRDPRAAIIACYARLETTVEAAGVPRRRSDTPFDLLGRFLAEHDIAAESALHLTGLFERAKFSRHEMDEGLRREALEALEDVRAELRAALQQRDELAANR